MCGIIGYIGKEQALPFILEGLRKESYRGYDSSGVVVFDNNNIHYIKSVGKLENLVAKLEGKSFLGNIGLGHNRWATHGNVTQANAHPHVDCKNNIFVTHNGIIENDQILKEKLKKEGHVFVSQTDTEVLAHLIESLFVDGNLEQAVSLALKQVRGTYAIAVIAKGDPDKIVVARLSAPLVISVNKRGGFVASDPAAIISHSNNMIFLDDGEIGVIKKDSYAITDVNGIKKKKSIEKLSWTVEETQKSGHPHFMLKEIFEHPESISNALKGRILSAKGTVKLGGLERIKDKLAGVNNISIIACGGSSYAAKVGGYMLEEFAGLPTKVETASEFRYKKSVFDVPVSTAAKKTLYIFISQSGETADTLAAVKKIEEQEGLAIGIVNVVGSTLAREIGVGVYTHSGPEIAVASTKTFTAQLAALCLITLFLGRQRQLSASEGKKITRELSKIPSLVEQLLERSAAIKKIAKKYYHFSNFCVIGRKYNYPIALEGALKLKEVAYIHGEGIEGGELKHGYLSLIGEEFPTIAICPSDSVYEKMLSNIQEIKARNGKVIAIANQGNQEIKKIVDDVIYIPKTLEMLSPILATIPLHLFAYHAAVFRGCEIDQPRNLAKSVTVE